MPDVHNTLSLAPRPEGPAQRGGRALADDPAPGAGALASFAALFDDAVKGAGTSGGRSRLPGAPVPVEGAVNDATGNDATPDDMETPDAVLLGVPVAGDEAAKVQKREPVAAAADPVTAARGDAPAVSENGAPRAATVPGAPPLAVPAHGMAETSVAVSREPAAPASAIGTWQPDSPRSASPPPPVNATATVPATASGAADAQPALGAQPPERQAAPPATKTADASSGGPAGNAVAALRIDAAPNVPRRRGAASEGGRVGAPGPGPAAAVEGMRVGVRIQDQTMSATSPAAGKGPMAAPVFAAGARAAEPDISRLAASSERELGEASFPAPAQSAGAATRPQAPVMPQAEVARHVAAQIAHATPAAAGREVELTLNPQELGRVRISLSHQDAGLAMSITAERGETVDLMRRHIDQLAREFRDLGYGDVSFSFGQSGQGRHGPGTGPEGPVSMVPAPDAAAQPVPASPGYGARAATGLDLRV